MPEPGPARPRRRSHRAWGRALHLHLHRQWQGGRPLVDQSESIARERDWDAQLFMGNVPPGEGQDQNDVLRVGEPAPRPDPIS